MASSPVQPSPPLKGRRKFKADLQDATQIWESGFQVKGLYVKDLRDGEDEGSILCEIMNTAGVQYVSLNLICSDTSDYPGQHSFICCAQDFPIPKPPVLEVIGSMTEAGPLPIQDILTVLLMSLSKKLIGFEDSYSDVSEDESLIFVEDDYYDDVSYHTSTVGATEEARSLFLQMDFNEVVAAGYRPGHLRLSRDKLILSVSTPAFSLARTIPARALMAWDSRLLSTTQYLTLVISGISGVYPVLQDNGTLDPGSRSTPRFHVGLTYSYKPDHEQFMEISQKFNSNYGLDSMTKNSAGAASSSDTQPASSDSGSSDGSGDESEDLDEDASLESEEEEEVFDRIEDHFHFSLSTSLEDLMNDCFLELVQIRLKYNVGWSGAEYLRSEANKTQVKVSDAAAEYIYDARCADENEENLSRTYQLPPDPLFGWERDRHLNLPLIAYSYLIRRLTLCSRYCLVCYEALKTDFQALKPYVCDKELCTYQYYHHSRGPSFEYEICARPQTVDLLISLAYIAADEGGLNDFPDFMGLMVPLPSQPDDQLHEFDTLDVSVKRAVIKNLLNEIPPIEKMKSYLMKGKGMNKLKDMPDISQAALLVLRWCIGSCTAQLEELTDPEDRVQGVGQEWRQFRFTVGAPDAEAKFQEEQNKQLSGDSSMRELGLYGFHGSPAQNWHSIIRHGLWYKHAAHGRSHGDGVYFALDGNYSISNYAGFTSKSWGNSALQVGSCVALAELVNSPSQFRHSSGGIFVVQHTSWIVCRFLLVKTTQFIKNSGTPKNGSELDAPAVRLNPGYPIKIGTNSIVIPEPSFKLDRLLVEREDSYYEEEYDVADLDVFNGTGYSDSAVSPTLVSSPEVQKVDASKMAAPIDDWEHDPEWVESCLEHMLPPPTDSSQIAVATLQRALTATLKEQEEALSKKELGWHLPEEFIGDNLFQWVVEIHSFEKNIPLAQDMETHGINSLVLEIRFPPDYPHSPPFVRILQPRLLPFLQGGGGHVTNGGSMCLELLTSSGWSPVNSIPQVLLQIKVAISNLDPRPARLASNWETPYKMNEAVQAFKRVASNHGWKIPETIDRLTQGVLDS